MTRFLMVVLVSLSSVLARAETSVDGMQLLTKASEVLNSITTDYILNVEACVDSKGELAVIYSQDFRTSVAYVYDGDIGEYNAPVPFKDINLTMGETVEVQDYIKVFKATLGTLDLTCAQSLMVLETPM